MKLKYQMSVLEMDGEPIAVPMDSGDQFRGVIRMNDTAADILKYLADDLSEDELVSILLKEYDATEDAMRASVRKVIEALRANDLLAE